MPTKQQWTKAFRKVEIEELRAENERLRGMLKKSLDWLWYTTDKGPFEAGWKSDALSALIEEIEKL